MSRFIIGEAGPMTNANPANRPVPDSPRPRVLVVDDHDMGRKSLARLLVVLGYEVTEVKDGESAIQTMEQDHAFDYVLTDLRLPDLDGREVVQAAHRLLDAAKIALITGWDVEPEETRRLGIDWIFLKPLDVQMIVSTLRQSPPSDLK